MLLILVIVFGSLGGMLGDRYQRRHGGQGLAESGCVIVGSVGLLLGIWIIHLLGGK